MSYLDVSYAFVILLKTDEQVEATQTVTLMDTRALRVSKIHFSDLIRFTNLPVDFTVLLEIYALVCCILWVGCFDVSSETSRLIGHSFNVIDF